ncbi:MAG TPA: S24 family peptidase [Sphingomonas sp.]|nr:S24 family peptidase [Sphingomonas sp.]
MEPTDPRATLATLVARTGASYAALSRLIGRNAAYLQQFVARGSPRRLDERDRRLLAAYFGVAETDLGAERDSVSAVVAVPRFDVAASAGPGALVDAEPRLGALGLDPGLLARLSARPRDLSLIRAAGDSMAPTVLDGDELLVDRGDRRVRTAGAVFIVRLDDSLLVKRVSRADGYFHVASDNPAWTPIETATLDVIGRVVWLSRAFR